MIPFSNSQIRTIFQFGSLQWIQNTSDIRQNINLAQFNLSIGIPFWSRMENIEWGRHVTANALEPKKLKDQNFEILLSANDTL